jgi:hypothetical protein
MATPQFAPGYAGKSNFTPTGGAATDINILGWDWQEEIGDLETTHSGSGGVEERIAGILKGKGAVQANYDLANQHHKTPPNINSGVKGVLKLYVSASLFYQIPIMILNVPIKSAVAGKVEFSFSYGLSGDSGTYLKPA